ncbi:MAG: AAA family ATPase [Treponema sp.]|jgi:exonuclease SbcC|nr:AAA family ATPase [Treponema sp.]
MKPEKLTMRNFGPFTGTEIIDFSVLDGLFLVSGKTGAGKTTIFDALCFALYGSVPGSRRNHLSRLRSDYAPDGADCFVSLEFSIGEKRRRIDRSPKGRGAVSGAVSGAVKGKTDPGAAVLYDIIRGEAVNPVSKKSEVDQRIRSLIGLEAEEFFKIVLLPQGEFAEFLRQSTSERRDVLGKLFPVDRAVRIRELAQEKAREAALESREAERALLEIGKRVSFDTYDDAHLRAERALEEARSRIAHISGEIVRRRELLSLRRQETETLERLKASQTERERLEAEAPAIREKEERLALSRKAQPLRHHLILAGTRKTEAEQAEAERIAAEKEKALAHDALRRVEEQSPLMGALEEESRALTEKRPILLAAIEEEEKLRRDTVEAETLRSRLERLLEEKNTRQAALERKEEEIRALQTRAAEADELNARWERERLIFDRLGELKKISGEAEVLNGEMRELEKKLDEIGSSGKELARRIPILEEELRRLKEEKKQKEQADMAACLGAGLKSGEPCPVCGSREHPLPAAAAAPVFGLDERIGAQERALKDAAGSLAARNAEGESRREEYERLEKRLAALKDRFNAVGRDGMPAEMPADDAFIPSLSEAAGAHTIQLERLNLVTARKSDAQRALTQLTGLYREQRSLQAISTEREKEYAALEEKRRNLAAEISRAATRHESLNAGRPGAAALADLERRLKEIGERLRNYREAGETARNHFAAASARAEQSRRDAEERLALHGEAAGALKEALAASPFAGEEALTEALLPSETETRWEDAIRRWGTERSRQESLETELRRSLDRIRGEGERIAQSLEAAGVTVGDIGGENTGGEEARIELLAKKQEAAETERDRVMGELLTLERDRASLKEAHERFQRLAAESGRLNALADDLSGKNPQKIPFDAWLLGRYLMEVALFATRRLERMSEGRYSLLLDNSGERNRGWTGLDLAVFDAYTGKTRPCATLSGGESFMASISLALGLADSIQNRSGGIRLDAVFIDEGFGSLDEGTLDKALVILDELRNQRMVGVISHVGELRSRIPSRIEVIKSGTGSKIRYVTQ